LTGGRARPAAVVTVGVTALLTGTGIGVFAHAVTTSMRPDRS